MTTTDVADAYRLRSAKLLDVLTAVPDDAWDRPSPCEEWTVRDVVAHLAESERDIVTRVGLELPAGTEVTEDPRRAMTEVVDAMQAILDDPERAELEYDGAFGRTTLGQTVGTFFVFDLLVHRWDIAQGASVETTLDEDELDGIEQSLDTIGDSLYAYGACKRLEVSQGSDRQTRVLARLGRKA